MLIRIFCCSSLNVKLNYLEHSVWYSIYLKICSAVVSVCEMAYMKYQLTLTTTNKNRWHILFIAVNSIQYKAQRFNTIHMKYTKNHYVGYVGSSQ